MPASAPSLVQNFLRNYPNIAACLRTGLINHSALARFIASKTGAENFEAMVKAIDRFAAQSRGRVQGQRQISTLIRDAKIKVNSKMTVIVIERTHDYETLIDLERLVRRQNGDFRLVDSDEGSTLFTNDRFVPEFRRKLGKRLLYCKSGLAQIMLIVPPDVEMLPGFNAYVFNALWERGINVLQEVSCWTDLMLVVDHRDLVAALETLNNC
jgi:hypothetical protein